MIRELRLVLPPWWMIAIAITFYLAIEGTTLYCEWLLGARLPFSVRGGVVVWLVSSLVYGAYRAWVFHPVFDLRYRQWLQLTPWTEQKPLPLGPPQLVWQDSIVLAVLLALGNVQIDLNPVMLLTAYFAGYLTVLALALWLTDEWTFGYALAFALGLALLFWPYPWACTATAALLYPVSLVGLRRSLARFPWNTPRFDEFFGSFRPGEAQRIRATKFLGWPFDDLQPRWSAESELRLCNKVLGSLLCAWLLYAVAALVPDEALQHGFLSYFQFVAVLVVAGGRLMIYCLRDRPPISFWGRVRTGQWIISGYDQVFLAPLGTLLIGLVIPQALYPYHTAAVNYFPPFLALALLVGFNIGPRLKVWRLTAPRRLWTPPFPGGEAIRVG